MKHLAFILFVVNVLLWSCKKENTTPVSNPAPVNPIPPLPLPPCQEIPPGPQPFGWKDSCRSEDLNVNFFTTLPGVPGEFLYCVNGVVYPLNRMYVYNYSSSQRIYVGERDAFLPHLNNKGWMLFSKPDQNLMVVKFNGDSARQLTSSGLFCNPQWGPNGQYLYAYQQTTSLSASALVKINLNGQVLASYPGTYPNSVPSNTEGNIYSLDVASNRLVVKLRQLSTNSETLVVSSGFNLSGVQNDFFNLSVDRKEEFLYWSNAKGLLRCNIQTKQVDTLFKNCPNLTFMNPVISENSEELTFCCKILTPLNSLVLYREYRCFEYHLDNKQWRELKFFPD